MKLLKVILLTILIAFIVSKHTKKSHKNKRQNTDNFQFDTIASFKKLEPKHISETFYGGNPNTLPKDRHFLWKDFRQNQFERPFFHGVVGTSHWQVPYAEQAPQYSHISSPVPRPNYRERVIASDLPPATHSHTSFELPKRPDVIQIELPHSSTHTSEKYADPRYPPKGPVSVSQGSMYHGTASTDANSNKGLNQEPTAANHQTNNSDYLSFVEGKKHRSKKHKRAHNRTRFLRDENKEETKTEEKPVENKEEKKEEKKEESQKKKANDLARSSLETARKIESTATGLLESITSSPHADDGKMILDIQMRNKRDIKDLVHTNNYDLEKHMKDMKRTDVGLKAMHTKPFLPQNN
jgi:hypothetical protein